MYATSSRYRALELMMATIGIGFFMTACSSTPSTPSSASGSDVSTPTAAGAMLAKGPQYDSTHVYVHPGTIGIFIASWTATFGGSISDQRILAVTPTPSKTKSQVVLSPVGALSIFDFQTPIPYLFGTERTGLLLTDFDAGVRAARTAGANIIVAPFPDPIGRDAIVQFPGGINTQVYWHKTAPNYAPLTSVPENRIYLTVDSIVKFLHAYLEFTGGKIVTDDSSADSAGIGLPGGKYRRIEIQSKFGNALVMVTDGHLTYPFGRELTGYGVTDLQVTLAKATGNGAKILWGPTRVDDRVSALVQFPGGYIAEIHSHE